MNWTSLDSKFFQDHPPRREFFDRCAQDFAWSSEVLPVYQWEQLIYIAAVDPQSVRSQKEDWPSHWILLQCEAGPLEALWKTWSAPLETPSTPNFPPPPPAFEAVSLSREITQPRIELEAMEPTKPQSPPRLPMAPPAGNAVPVNIDLDFKPDDLFASIENETPAKSSSETQELLLQDAPSEDELEAEEKAEDAPLDMPEGLALEGTLANEVEAADISSDLDLTLNPDSPFEAEASNASPENLPENFSEEFKARLENRPEGYFRSLFAIKAGNSLRIEVSSNSAKMNPNADLDLSLGVPSPFRIALRTQKSYHGPVSGSPFMNSFFQNWNEGQTPACLSVVPLSENDQVLGFLILFGEAHANSKTHLAVAEQMASELYQIWSHASKQLRAKAS